MTDVVSDRSNTNRSVIHWLHPVVVVAFIFIAYLLTDLVAQWSNSDRVVGIDLTAINLTILVVAVVVVVYEIGNLVISLVRLSISRSFSHLLAIVFLLSAAVFSRQLAVVVQYSNLFLFPRIYEACEQSAVPYGDKGRFKLCSARSNGNAYTMVVYDSGGEIALSRAEQSELFKTLLTSKNSPILSECKVAPVKKLTAHFYFVQSDCDSRPE